METLHLGIVSPSEIFREGLRRILIEKGFAVDQVASAGSELEEQADDTRLVVVVTVESSAGLASCHEIRLRRPRARVALMVDEYDPTSVTKAFQTGAVDGYLIKQIGCEPLAQSLRLIAMGEKLLPSQLASYISGGAVLPPPHSHGDRHHLGLSAREIEILSCLVDGDANKVISRRLQISDATVKVHIKAILRKLGVKNRTQAAIWAVSHGVLGRDTSPQIWPTSTRPMSGPLPMHA